MIKILFPQDKQPLGAFEIIIRIKGLLISLSYAILLFSLILVVLFPSCHHRRRIHSF